jgi:hypothetical protein
MPSMALSKMPSIFRGLLARAEEEEPMLKTLPAAAASEVFSTVRRSIEFGVGSIFWGLCLVLGVEFLRSVGKGA